LASLCDAPFYRGARRRRHQALPRASAASTGDSGVLASEGRLLRRGENCIDLGAQGRRRRPGPAAAFQAEAGSKKRRAFAEAGGEPLFEDYVVVVGRVAATLEPGPQG